MSVVNLEARRSEGGPMSSTQDLRGYWLLSMVGSRPLSIPVPRFTDLEEAQVEMTRRGIVMVSSDLTDEDVDWLQDRTRPVL